MFRALRAYGDSFKYGTASTADFQRINEHFYGRNLDWFFNEWVYARGYPKYTITWNKQQVGANWQVIATLAQHNDTNSLRLFHMPYPVRFNCTGESVLVVFHPQDTVALDTFVLAAEPLSVTPDPDNWVLDSCHVAAGIEEMPNAELRTTNVEPSIVRGVLLLPPLGTRSELPERNSVMSRAALVDAIGRKVLDLRPGPNDVSRLAPGVYFVLEAQAQAQAQAIRKVIIQH